MTQFDTRDDRLFRGAIELLECDHGSKNVRG